MAPRESRDVEQRSHLLALLGVSFVAEAPEAGLSGAAGSAKVERRRAGVFRDLNHAETVLLGPTALCGLRLVYFKSLRGVSSQTPHSSLRSSFGESATEHARGGI